MTFIPARSISPMVIALISVSCSRRLTLAIPEPMRVTLAANYTPPIGEVSKKPCFDRRSRDWRLQDIHGCPPAPEVSWQLRQSTPRAPMRGVDQHTTKSPPPLVVAAQPTKSFIAAGKPTTNFIADAQAITRRHPTPYSSAYSFRLTPNLQPYQPLKWAPTYLSKKISRQISRVKSLFKLNKSHFRAPNAHFFEKMSTHILVRTHDQVRQYPYVPQKIRTGGCIYI